MSISRLLSGLIAVVLVVVAVLTARGAVATSDLVNGGTIDTAAARWQALGEYYVRQAQEAARIQRAQAADVARWVAMGKAYSPAMKAQSAQPAYDAETARWVALGEYYVRQADEAQRTQRARNADAARWTAKGEYYAKLQAKL
jgi:hypothetical protein